MLDSGGPDDIAAMAMQPVVKVPEAIAERARVPIERMVAIT